MWQCCWKGFICITGHTKGFHSQTPKLAPPFKTPSFNQVVVKSDTVLILIAIYFSSFLRSFLQVQKKKICGNLSPLDLLLLPMWRHKASRLRWLFNKKTTIFHSLYRPRESSFNMTRGGDEDIETRSLKFQQPPSLAVQFFRSPPLLLQFLCSPEKRSLDCIKYIYRYCLQWFIL